MALELLAQHSFINLDAFAMIPVTPDVHSTTHRELFNMFSFQDPLISIKLKITREGSLAPHFSWHLERGDNS